MNYIHKNTALTQAEAGELHLHIGQTVRVHGAVHKIREMAGFAFVILRTKRGMLQCIYSAEVCDFALGDIAENMSLVALGEVLWDERSKSGVELKLKQVEILSAPLAEPPVRVFERVYEIAPVYRAEKHDTSRHLSEYTSLDFEMGFIENFYDICRMETKMLAYLFDFLRGHYGEELALLQAEAPQITEIPCLRFWEAKELVAKTYKREIMDFEDFEPEEEKLLCKTVKKQTGCDFVFVTHYKSSKRPFYAMDSRDDPEVTESFDLLFRGMEITTGGQRIHGYGQQVLKMEARGMNPADFTDFLMAHKYGLPPHGGLGLGLERLTARLLNLPNVRLASLFPRDRNRLRP